VQPRNLATAGGNLASAVPSADLAPPLLVRDAVARIASPGGDRTIPVEALFEGPHRSALRPDEVLTHLEIPMEEGGAGEAFLKFGKRRAQVLAVVNAAARVRLNGGLIEDARIALGAVAPTPIRARTAEALLRGHRPDPELLDDAGQAAAAEARPISDMRASANFRLELCRVLVRRALERAVGRAERHGAGHDA
ncbi:MAG: FAD binding domain-containing protein, partial [Firmicutes bacterium]|nr:FAD binding domain-containing protein [Bacillota bacterium]